MSEDSRFDGLRRASAQDWFPYKGIGPRSYYEVESDGTMRQLNAIAELRAAVPKAKAGEIALLAVWTGQYRSDIFHIDDIDALEAEI